MRLPAAKAPSLLPPLLNDVMPVGEQGCPGELNQWGVALAGCNKMQKNLYRQGG